MGEHCDGTPIRVNQMTVPQGYGATTVFTYRCDACGKEASAQMPEHADLLDTYHLFGDPAMALNLTIRPWPFSTYLPVGFKNLSGG